MIKEIVKDPIFLKMKSENATKEDLYIAQDLIDTLTANSDRCVGMASNMIGYNKNIIIANAGEKNIVMINPIITDHCQKSYETMEGCLSLTGQRKAIRYKVITVEYYDTKMKKQKRTFRNDTAQIIQHEIDHCSGILI